MMFDNKTLDLHRGAHEIRDEKCGVFHLLITLRADQEVIGFYDLQLKNPGK